MSAHVKVRVGQIWEDNDPRSCPARRLKVLEVKDGKAQVQDPEGRGIKTKIRLDRFGSTRQTGYTLVEQVPTKDSYFVLEVEGPAKKAGSDHIHVWPFDEAPEHYRALSTAGGDEDWVALVPGRLAKSVSWLESGTAFGVCSVRQTVLDSGDVVFIGAHA